ncbi:MAG: Leu/Phe/Val dehydrogenase [Anaerolineae bacterium]
MNVFDHPEYDNHEQVVFFADDATGLRAIVAVHNSNLGPGAGGCRMWNYASFDDALTDVLRLSKGMSYKSSLAGLDCGGGKSVIIADPNMPRAEKDALMRAFARHLQTLGGRYWAAEDVGTSVEDARVMMQECDYIFGLPDGSGDPSPFTALGVFQSMRATAQFQLGRDSLAGIKVAVQGVGHVGYHLCQRLHQTGAELFVTDINQEVLARVASELGASVVAPDAIYDLDVDIYAPCALGATLNDATIPRLKASMIVGAANNQLAEPRHGDRLHEMGILYAPDYVANAGGMINASGDIFGAYSEAWATQKVMRLYDTCLRIFETSRATETPTYRIANQLAEERMRHTMTVGAGD